MKAIIVTKAEFDDLNLRIQQYCLNNIVGYKAIKWAEEKIHPTDGRIAMVVEDKILPALTVTEKSKIEELTANWFPATVL